MQYRVFSRVAFHACLLLLAVLHLQGALFVPCDQVFSRSLMLQVVSLLRRHLTDADPHCASESLRAKVWSGLIVHQCVRWLYFGYCLEVTDHSRHYHHVHRLEMCCKCGHSRHYCPWCEAWFGLSARVAIQSLWPSQGFWGHTILLRGLHDSYSISIVLCSVRCISYRVS